MHKEIIQNRLVELIANLLEIELLHIFVHLQQCLQTRFGATALILN